jgi:hypothetical protein
MRVKLNLSKKTSTVMVDKDRGCSLLRTENKFYGYQMGISSTDDHFIDSGECCVKGAPCKRDPVVISSLQILWAIQDYPQRARAYAVMVSVVVDCHHASGKDVMVRCDNISWIPFDLGCMI